MVENAGDKAVEFFASGFNCSESVLLASIRELNKPTEHIFPCFATGFGGGIARTGSTCGALTGAIMIIGLIIGPRKAGELEKKEEVYKIALRIIQNFEKEFGSSLCINLTKCDLRTPEGHENFQSQKIKETVCSKFVEWCAKYVTRLIETR